MLPIFRMPVVLYRAGLGRLMGRRFMMLTHVGRRSRRVRYTILAVLSFDSKTKEVKAISAWPGSDWYYNIKAAPALELECGVDRYAPTHRMLPAEEIATLFMEYRRAHPLFSSIVCRIPGWRINSSYEEFVELARTLRGIAFRPAVSLAEYPVRVRNPSHE